YFIVLPPHPDSPLFPYTTLFRSSLLDANMLSSCSGVPQICCTTATTQGICTSPVPFDSMSGICPTWPFVKRMAMYFLDLVRRQLDRKSTRLNSSHLVISYAVFCL